MKNVEQLATPYGGQSAVSSQSRKPATGLIARTIERMFAAIQSGSLAIQLPAGNWITVRGSWPGPDAVLRLRKWTAARRFLTGGEVAFAEAYMEGELDIDSLTALFHWYMANEEALEANGKGSRVLSAFNRFIHLVINDNSKTGSAKNISYHYDLGNAFYSQWLDETMTYSSADFSVTDNLADAQTAKYSRMAQMARVADGKSVLEIGCGWGGFAEHVLSRHEIDYKGITISSQQLAWAERRLHPWSERKSPVVFEDYRDTTGQYDCIVSIEMFEAVGEKHWPTYFDAIKRLLKPGGHATIQVITIDHERFQTYRRSVDFIQKYIFPGGMLPSVEVFSEHAQAAGLLTEDTYHFGKSYAETLRRWRHDFLENWPVLETQGFDERFKRMWLYYLEYCEAGFDAGSIDVVQFTLKNE